MKKLILSMSLFFIGVFVHAQDSENVEEVIVIGTKASLKVQLINRGLLKKLSQ